MKLILVRNHGSTNRKFFKFFLQEHDIENRKECINYIDIPGEIKWLTTDKSIVKIVLDETASNIATLAWK